VALFEKKSIIEVPVRELFEWHKSPKAFERLAPPWEKIKVLEKQGGITDENKVVLEMRQGPFRSNWVSVHRDYIEGRQFRDEQTEGPFAKWVHTHQTSPESDKTSLLTDHIEYELPMGILGRTLGGEFIRRKLERTFAFRHARTRKDLSRLHPYAGKPRLKIVISGATGLVGTALTAFLMGGGHSVWTLVRKTPGTGSSEIFWDPTRKAVDKTALECMDAVIHLSGENIGAGKWTPERKQKILNSRVDGTRFLAETLASLQHPPRVLLSSSAVGFYGDRGEEVLSEESPVGKGFLTDVCKAWEEACEPARKAGIRVINVRTGIVLSSLGGALSKMLPPFLMGGGGVIGTGDQWMSWVSLEDLVGLFHFLIYAEGLSGPVNATAPEPLTNRDFTKVLGKVLKRPAFFPLPGFMVKAVFGEMGQSLLLEGQKVLPIKITRAGFSFLHPSLESALNWELGK